MSKKEFDEFLEKVTDNSSEEAINWSVKRDEWLQSLSEFYGQISGFLAEYEKAGKVRHASSNHEIFEEYIGRYSVPVVEIGFGKHQVVLQPVGTNLIGAKGRVDLIGAYGTVKFVLVNKDAQGPRIKVDIWGDGEEPSQENHEEQAIEWNWKISTPPPNMQYISLTQDTFFSALMGVVDV